MGFRDDVLDDLLATFLDDEDYGEDATYRVVATGVDVPVKTVPDHYFSSLTDTTNQVRFWVRAADVAVPAPGDRITHAGIKFYVLKTRVQLGAHVLECTREDLRQ